MNKQEAIDLIKNATKAVELLFTGNKEVEQVEENFEPAKEIEGDVLVQVDGELAIGTAVSTSTSDGSEPAADGDYKLANGVEISVKDGVISEVISEGDAVIEDSPAEELADAEVPAEDAVEDAPIEDEKPSEVAELKSKISELEAEIAKLKEGFSALPNNETMEAFTAQLVAFQSAIEILATTPAEFTKVDRSVEAKDNKANKLNALAGIMNK